MSKCILSGSEHIGRLDGVFRPKALAQSRISVGGKTFHGVELLAQFSGISTAKTWDLLQRATIGIVDVDVLSHSGFHEAMRSPRLSSLRAAVKLETGIEVEISSSESLNVDAQCQMSPDLKSMGIVLNVESIMASGQSIEFILAHEHAHLLAAKMGYSINIKSAKLINLEMLANMANPNLFKSLFFTALTAVDDYCHHFVVNNILAGYDYRQEIFDDYENIYARINNRLDPFGILDFSRNDEMFVSMPPFLSGLEIARRVLSVAETLSFLPEAERQEASAFMKNIFGIDLERIQSITETRVGKNEFFGPSFLRNFTPKVYGTLLNDLLCAFKFPEFVDMEFEGPFPGNNATKLVQSANKLIESNDLWPALARLSEALHDEPENASAQTLQSTVRDRLLTVMEKQGYSGIFAYQKLLSLAERFDVKSESDYWRAKIGNSQ